MDKKLIQLITSDTIPSQPPSHSLVLYKTEEGYSVLDTEGNIIPIAEAIKELASLRRFKRLACKAFEYPRDIEMLGFSAEDKQFLYAEMEAEHKLMRQEKEDATLPIKPKEGD